jgi:DNA polymerase-3 subunit delta'
MSVNFSWPIYGHNKQINFLQASLQQNTLPNAYLFYGPKGLGKKMIAEYFAKSLFCQNTEQKPCQKCTICHHVEQGVYADAYFLGKNTEELSAESIKDFLASLKLASSYGQHKLAIIYQADKINLFSANALLKILEEPPKNTTIILVADQIDYLPATILSRCQLLKFQALSKKVMSTWLENFSLQELERETILNLSFGKPGRALNFMEDNLANFKEKCDWLLKILSTETLSALQILENWFEIFKKNALSSQSLDLPKASLEYLDILELFWRDLLYAKLDRKVLNVLYQEEIKKLTSQYSYTDILKNLLAINKIKKQIKNNVSPQMLWENLVLNFKA